ncbi:MAG TPA: (d)CMP kinase [Gemmatimonadales bacterium]|nr:(d)CMP kinase [Gemmatimonadales bacterium]
MRERVVAIDGPAGSGKTTTAREVARRLGFIHLDSGALYRAITLAALDAGLLPEQETRVVALAAQLPIRWVRTERGFRPEVAGADVSEAIRETRVTARVSAYAARPAIRDWVNDQLRAAAADVETGVVVEGRDIGTVVFPHAGLKVFLTASAEARAARRLAQEGKERDPTSVRRQTVELTRRDEADANRDVAPLRAPPDAHVIDTTDLSFDEQVSRVVELARQAFA